IGETFGAAQRGGSVFSSLRISKTRTYGPLIPNGAANLIVSLEPLETLRMLSNFGNEKVVTISNTQTTMPVGVLAGRNEYPTEEKLRGAIEELSQRALFVPATDIAVELGAPIVSNIVLLGALLGAKLLPISEEEVKEDMRSTFPAGKLELNYQALQRGIDTVA
ncbi:MAG: 2-oxoacid:acceptor oxidoreductase family protein, partial [Proteobacteria bacterium]|nr:2-oxoacid:acceptor oxidoreductase family protein [Pseudomonadota bacterium]